MANKIYLIPGRGDKLNDFIGNTLIEMGFEVYGREILSDFARLHFPQQLEIIKNDLKSQFWHQDAIIIGDSYGAYLLLQALVELAPFPGCILLFSPVLGKAIDKKNFIISSPPRSKKLLQLAEQKKFPIPRYLEIHTGAKDNGCDPQLAKKISALITGSKIYIVEGEGHRLNKNYIKNILAKLKTSDVWQTSEV
jgi:predicted esterase